jgi:pyruvate dehydrogenase E2 component (dihydrolipoamide acetyltransferase)
MPKWGLSMKEGKLLSWTVKEGDEITKADEIADVETEKIASAVEATTSGILRKIVTVDDTIYPVGALLGIVADESVSDDEINAFVEKFQSEFVPPEDDDEEEESAAEFITVNDLNIRYVSKGEGDDVVVLIHGFGGDLDNWLFNHDNLVEKSDKRVIAIDLPGHGQSTKSVGDGSFGFFADVIHKFISLMNIDAVHLVGHSMGGAISLQFAEKYPDSTKSLALISSAGLGSEINSDYLNGFAEATSRKQIKPFLQQLFADKDLVTRQLINNILQYKRLDGVDNVLKTIINSFLADGKQQNQFNDSLEKFEGGVCVVWGSQDQIIPVQHTDNLSNEINVLKVETAGHMVQMEAANQVNQFLIDTNLS